MAASTVALSTSTSIQLISYITNTRTLRVRVISYVYLSTN